jgi:NAD(P)-dependent dehydrogenase (short-subunit alcohol dehydrogenase family)
VKEVRVLTTKDIARTLGLRRSALRTPWSWAALLAGSAAGLALAVRAKRSGRYDLRDRVAVVTGGSRGLGFLVAEELARAGCRVVICARDPRELALARDQLSPHTDVLAVTCDVSNPSDVERLLARAVTRFGRIDLLINNASIIQVGPLEATTLQEFQRALDINFWGTVHTTLAALPHMRRQGDGRIVNIASIGGKVAVPHLLPYDCAKFAVVGFSEGLRAEAARHGISVTTVVPGLMRTGSEKFADFKTEGDARWFSAAARMPLLTVSARSAARRIVAAARRRRGEVVIGLPAKLLRLVHDLFPAATMRTLDVSNRLLPRAKPV